MKNIDSYTHVRGESVYLDDIPLVQGTLFASVYDSPVAHAIIEHIDITEALASPGVVRVLLAKDIPGENQIGGIIADEELLADKHVHFCGMPIALVVATSDEAAKAAVKKIKTTFQSLPFILDAREACAKNELIVPPRTFQLGNTTDAWSKCAHIFEGRTETNGQEHLYLETQGAYAIPQENGTFRIYSSTQGPTAVQRTAGRILQLPMNLIEVDTTRLGGGFGGKEDQATTWAVLCVLAAWHTGRPVKYCLHRMEDMRMTGKRHPYSSDFKIGLDEELRIISYEAAFYQNAGAAADLSPAVLERTLFHCTNTYFIPNVKATAYSCRTNIIPNTAFRGFGGPQGMFVIEAAIAKAAEALNIPASVIQKKNLLKTGDEFPYGQLAESEATECWVKAEELYQPDQLEGEISLFNRQSRYIKKGMSWMPICFGISFTKTHMNQARALVHVYNDGSVGVSTAGVEMGQGLNTKILQVAAATFNIPAGRVRINTTNTYRVANTSPTAASASSDLNGKATEIACLAILDRMKNVAAENFDCKPAEVTIEDDWVFVKGKKTDWPWNKLAWASFENRVSLSESAHYAPEGIYFDNKKEKGHPFTYHVYGTAITTVTLDCIRGTYTVDGVKIVHDFGKSMNHMVDIGQVEGALVQGIGWMTMEEIVFDDQGRLRSNALSTYKVPDIHSAPSTIDIHFLETEKENLAIMRSKAVGEPPLMYGIGTYFAIHNAIKAFRPSAVIPFDAPITPEKVLMALHNP